MQEAITDENYLAIAAKYYNNHQINSSDEIMKDLFRATLIQRWIVKYINFIEKDDYIGFNKMSIRLFLNNFIIFKNVFDSISQSLLYFLVAEIYHPQLNSLFFIFSLLEDSSLYEIDEKLVIILNNEING